MVIIALLLVCSGLIFIINNDENANVVAEVSGNVSGTWGPGTTYYVVGDLTVQAADTLTILADDVAGSTTLFFDGNYTLYVDGTLNVEGSVTSFVNFQSNASSPAAGDWKGIQFNVTSKGSIVNTEIKHATTALNINDSTPNLALIEFTSCIHHVNVTTSDVIISSSGVDVNKVTITDALGSLDVKYSVNVHAVNATAQPIPLDLPGVTVDIDSTQAPIGTQITGPTGWAPPINCTAYVKTQAGVDYSANNHTIQVMDSFSGTQYSLPGVSINITDENISSYQKVNDLTMGIYQIKLDFTFIYPPVIDDWPGKGSGDTITVTEDSSIDYPLEFHDNDHPNSTLILSVTSITYGDLIAKGWVTHLPASRQLQFYCTNEEWGNDLINISVKDLRGLVGFKLVTVNYVTVNDVPVINLSALYSVISVYEDRAKFIPIEIYDEDDPFDSLVIDIDSPYVVYIESNSTLKFLYPNEFGPDGAKETVNITVTDPHSASPPPVKILVNFNQVNDPVKINGTIPDQIKLETDVTWNLDLKQYRIDPDPDETFSWWVMGLDSTFLNYSGENGSAEILNFQIIGDDLGGADNPVIKTNTVTIWVEDGGGATASQSLDIEVSSVNTPPSLSKNSLTPASGNTADLYNFTIKYRDLDGASGDVPDYVKVGVSGVEYDMVQSDPSETDYSEGVTFYLETLLSAGEHEHYFICSDGADTGRLPHVDATPSNITGPSVDGRMYIKTFWSSDQKVSAKIAFYGEGGTAAVTTGVTSPGALPGQLGDLGLYFNIVTSNMISLVWTEIRVYYTSLDTTWVNNDTLSLYYWDVTGSAWEDLYADSMNDEYVIYNTTDPESILFLSPALVFTITSDLDADGDGYPNDDGYPSDSDKFPFDPAAYRDNDNDGHPDSWIEPDPSDEKESTIPTTLDYDEFPNNASEWDDADGDGYGDNIDEYDEDAAAWRDTDGDGMPDEIDKRLTTDLKEDTDDDNDGMPDWWEEKYGLNPKDASNADVDLDGDGYTNKEEYDEDTDPTDKDSFPDEDELISEEFLMYLIIIIIIVLVIVIVAVVISRRKKPEEEEAPEEEPEAKPPEPEERVEEPAAPAPAPAPTPPPPAPAPTPPAPAPPPVPPPMEELPPPPPEEEEEPEAPPTIEEEAAEEPPEEEEGAAPPAGEEEISDAEEDEMEELEEEEEEEEEE